MRSFKAQVERDLTTVFHQGGAHGDVLEFWLDGIRYKGPVILESGVMGERPRTAADHAEGLFQVDLTLYVPLSLLRMTPRKGQALEINHETYVVAQVGVEAGEIALRLEMLAE